MAPDDPLDVVGVKDDVLGDVESSVGGVVIKNSLGEELDLWWEIAVQQARCLGTEVFLFLHKVSPPTVPRG